MIDDAKINEYTENTQAKRPSSFAENPKTPRIISRSG